MNSQSQGVEYVPNMMDEFADELIVKQKQAVILKRQTEYVCDPHKDDLGLPSEHLSYVKKDCKKCHGRGYCIVSFVKPVNLLGIPVLKQYGGCPCQTKGYNKMRFAIDKVPADQRQAYIDDLKGKLG